MFVAIACQFERAGRFINSAIATIPNGDTADRSVTPHRLGAGISVGTRRDRHCQAVQAKALSHLKQLKAETQNQHRFDGSDTDGVVQQHPEAFQESLSWLMPDLSNHSEIEIDLLSRLVLACGDVSLVSFLRLSREAIAQNLIEQACFATA